MSGTSETLIFRRPRFGGHRHARPLNRNFQISRFVALVCVRFREPPGGPQKHPKGPRRALGDLPGASGAPGAQVKNTKTNTLLQGPLLGRTYGRILDFSFGGRTENGHGMVLELVSGSDFRCVLHHLASLTRLKGSWGQVWPANGPKPTKTAFYILVS